MCVWWSPSGWVASPSWQIKMFWCFRSSARQSNQCTQSQCTGKVHYHFIGVAAKSWLSTTIAKLKGLEYAPKRQYDNHHLFWLSPNSLEFRGNAWWFENRSKSSKQPKMSEGMADTVQRTGNRGRRGHQVVLVVVMMCWPWLPMNEVLMGTGKQRQSS